MQADVLSYLVTESVRLEQLSDDPAQSTLPAVNFLLQSRAYASGDPEGVQQLAGILKQMNLTTIRLAQQHPGAFESDLINSREAENRIYDGILTGRNAQLIHINHQVVA